ncbi:MAG TPA: PilN domain-containing protein [Thermoleophilaceae bacterium]|nr:PilN domain-containing protein [Thermoleophilaceae bacterium]
MRPVNLLPESQRRRQPSGQGGSAYVVLSALACLLIMVAVYVLTANKATSRDNDAAAASAKADQLEARAAEIGAFGDFAQVKETRLASVQQLAGSRFDWERLMRELARVLPSEGWVQVVKASTTGAIDSSGTATETVSAGPTAQLTGCMPRQSDVARLMLRLRRMHRVEDVTLKESTREQQGAPATLDNCGRLYKFDLTVAFAPATPQEAPDGRKSVPASLGGGS